jgi:hypothetical protein
MSYKFLLLMISLFVAKAALALAAAALRTGILVHGFHLDAAAWARYIFSFRSSKQHVQSQFTL